MSKQKICDVSEIESEKPYACTVAGENILIFKLDDGYYATQSKCTHLFFPLKNGKIIEGCKVRCPFHHAEFDIRSGQVAQWACFPPGIQLANAFRPEKGLKTYPVSVEDNNIFIELQQEELSS